MQDKQKVTLYLSSELHRKLKIRAAVDGEPMSALAQKALVFFLEHPEVVDSLDAVSGHAHQVYSCPSCETQAVIREGELIAVGQSSEAIEGDLVEQVNAGLEQSSESEEDLVTC
ncbi:hypothetical protein [Sodalinema gerasimenkoae]|uniref:hypothetical protein n=1 Tax=Sodalinema gerasimenkoae TaxID=2862348 RepID=UPI00135AD304|nr:hypothetical protein [Sodalinema gerasimenkoae]